MTRQSINYNQSGARERGVEMLATAVARLVNRCTCMSTEMRLRFMARLLDNVADAEWQSGQREPVNFSLEAIMQSADKNPDQAVNRAAALLTRSLRQEQGLDREGLYRFYDALFALLVPKEMDRQLA